MSNSSLFDVPTIEILFKRSEAARIAIDHLEQVLRSHPELAKPAALGVLYATISILDCPSKIAELPHFCELLGRVRWALSWFFEVHPEVIPVIQTHRLHDCILAIEEQTTLPPFSNIKALSWEARQELSDTTLSEGLHEEPLGPDKFRDAVRARILDIATRVRSNLVLWDKLTELSAAVTSSSS